LRSRLIYSGIVNADNNWTKILLADCLRCAVLTQPAFFFSVFNYLWDPIFETICSGAWIVPFVVLLYHLYLASKKYVLYSCA
jgi:hypothetical protein